MSAERRVNGRIPRPEAIRIIEELGCLTQEGLGVLWLTYEPQQDNEASVEVLVKWGTPKKSRKILDEIINGFPISRIIEIPRPKSSNPLFTQ